MLPAGQRRRWSSGAAGLSDEAASHYTLLGIPPRAGAQAIRAAFRQRIREVHPDLNRAPGAAELASQLTEAFRVLSNPVARSAYDGELRRHRLLQLSQADALARDGEARALVAGLGRRSLGGLLGGLALAVLIGGGMSATVWQLSALWDGSGPDTTSMTPHSRAAHLPIAVAAQTLAPQFRREAALAVPPVELAAVRLGQRKFQNVSWARGMAGAAAFSRRCHGRATQLVNWASADFCAAFDHAGYLVVGGSDDAASRAAAGYFIDRHTDQARFYAGFGIEEMLVDAHLDRLRATFPAAAAQSAPSPLLPPSAG